MKLNILKQKGYFNSILYYKDETKPVVICAWFIKKNKLSIYTR